MILSASGWRGVFALEGEESVSSNISAENEEFVRAAARNFAEFLREKVPQGCAADTVSDAAPIVITGMDTRPTGPDIASAINGELIAAGCIVHWLGIASAPEIMAYARAIGSNPPNICGETLNCSESIREQICGGGFLYVSASHNPIGHNGLKFGLLDGGVLNAEDAEHLLAMFESPKRARRAAQDGKSHELLDKKTESLSAYREFIGEVIAGDGIGTADLKSAMREALRQNPIGIVCDFNGSARAASIDREFFTDYGVLFKAINDIPGKIAHRIVPEGDALIPCCRALEAAHAENSAFTLGYVPDCDGDRGNLVIWNDDVGEAQAVEAQEVFALACLSELLHLNWTGVLHRSNVAIAANDATSMRVDRLAARFVASVFRAEIGEANVVSLARRLRGEGYLVRILGEGAAGGTITHPSSVRDPLCTVMAMIKMISLFNVGGQFASELRFPPIMLPAFATTGVYEPEALLKVKNNDHAALKRAYQKIFCEEWQKKSAGFAENGIVSWRAFRYNGIEEKSCDDDFGLSGRGGLKINFCDKEGISRASIWMRGSATEPVFRVMADVEISENRSPLFERELIAWQREMVTKADAIA